jgi:predicted alpha/beta superfamily hydrolase
MTGEAASRVESGGQPREYFPAIATHLIRSRFVPQTFKIQVMQPPQRREESRHFPVLYATDGNAMFDVLKGIAWLMQAAKLTPNFILVGIGYPGESPLAGELLRGRDLTFPGCPNFLHDVSWPWEGVLAPEEGTKDFAGAKDFQEFLAEELIPLIDGNYATVPGDRMYFGHSAGGGFGLWILFTQAHLFRGYIISSPILAYHGLAPDGTRHSHNDFMFTLAREFIMTGRSVDGVRLYMSVGAEEEFEPRIANWHFTSNLYRMIALMKEAAVPGLELATEAFPSETHMTAWLMAFVHGLRAMRGGAE